MDKKPNFLWPTNINHPTTKEFWKGLRQKQFLITKCRRCGEMFFPPRSHCPNCLGNDFEWVELHGESTLHSWTEISVTGPQFDTPLLLGLVDLPQGIGRIVARIVGTEAQQLKIGMPVKVSYADVHESFSLYYITTDQ